MNIIYKYPISLTQQFKHCGNAFRVDTYKGCDFGCKYCFATNRGGNYKNSFDVADFSIIENMFFKAFESNKEYRNITVEMLKHKVPLHLGGMSDPFQKREFDYRLTYKLIQLTNKYHYPMIISTKSGEMPIEYWNILNPNIHAFQISLFGFNENFVQKFEGNTYSPNQRINFIKTLKDNNFWVSLRMQPLISIDESIKLIKFIDDYVDFITVEHLKIPLDNKEIRELLFKLTNTSKSDYILTGREYELPTEVKIKNINIIKSISNSKIGCGDNDLHHMSDSNNCCGIDKINQNFNNWIKYNSMYLNKTNDFEIWYPKNNCQQIFNSSCRKKNYSFKDYVLEYMKNQ